MLCSVFVRSSFLQNPGKIWDIFYDCGYYVVRKDIPSPGDSKNRDVQIIHQKSLVGKVFTRDSSKDLNILKEPAIGKDSKTWIKVPKCDIKSMSEIQYHYGGIS